ncbi:MAG: hypothetical protein ACXVIS_07810 [Halobacteriota archaeon]
MCLDEKAVAAAIASARSLGEIEAWLKSQPRQNPCDLRDIP